MAKLASIDEIYRAYLETNATGDDDSAFFEPSQLETHGHIRPLRFDSTRTESARHHSLDRHAARQRKAQRFQA